MVLDKDIAKIAGFCYGCPNWISDSVNCSEGHNIKKMQKKGTPPCYEQFAGVLGAYNVKDEFDNVKTEYRS